jgi:Cof subfamily protein (haloacid dehalogenase superfamily)
MEQGVHIILATGKTRYSALDLIEHLDLKTPGIYSQGLILYDGDGTIRFQHTIADDVAQHIIDYADDNALSLLVYSGMSIYGNRFTDDPTRITQYGEPEPIIKTALGEIVGKIPINKLIFMDTPPKITTIRAELSTQLNGRATVVQALDDMLEVMPNGVSKGTAFHYLIDEMNIPSAETMAIGNAENDIQMIQAAGIGVAVDNSMDSLKAVADVIVPSNDEDGVGVAIERFVFQNQKRTPQE